MVSSCKFVVQILVYECLAGCVRERQRYRTNIKHATKVHNNIDDKKQSSNDARTSDATNKENDETMESKRELKTI